MIAAGDEDPIKIHFHTNEPWKVLEYCNSIGEIYDIVVEDMIRSVRRIARINICKKYSFQEENTYNSN